jgi:acyl carrier protein
MTASKKHTAEEISQRLTQFIAEALSVDPSEIDPKTPFDQYGIDSKAAMEMVANMEDYLGRRLSPTLPYDYPTIALLTPHLASDE